MQQNPIDAEPLSQHTTFGVGGPAAHWIEARTTTELVDAVQEADGAGEPLFVLSGGSNVLVGDDGFPGVVVHVANDSLHIDQTDDHLVSIWADAGCPMDALVAMSVEHGWSGLEALSGIPGLVGATPIQNIGAYGAEIASCVRSVTVWDRLATSPNDKTLVVDGQSCEFGYRDSMFKRSRANGQATGRYVIQSVCLQLPRSPLSAPIAYAELAKLLGIELGARAPLADVRTAVLQLRASKGMVVDDADPDSHSAGSFFTNPLLTAEEAARLPAGAPLYQQPDGRAKTSAAWLIEHAGFPKGFGDGPARLSSKHTLALTNQGGATAADIMALARTIQAGVKYKFGVQLVPEPILVGVDY